MKMKIRQRRQKEKQGCDDERQLPAIEPSYPAKAEQSDYGRSRRRIEELHQKTSDEGTGSAGMK